VVLQNVLTIAAKFLLGILVELESVNDPSSTLAPSFSVTLPSSRNVGEFWPESQQTVALPHDLQQVVTSQLGAVYVGFSLLQACVNALSTKKGKIAGFAALEHHQPWLQDSVCALWKHFRRWTTSSEKRPIHDEITTLYLDLLETAFFPTAAAEDGLPNSLKSGQALTSSLDELLENSSASSMSETNQIRLASMFARLCSVLKTLSAQPSISRRRLDATKTVMLNDTEAAVARACQNVEQFSQLHKDLQVRVRRCSTFQS
jgi:serine/threonine-protein kinase ATR